MIQFDFNAIGTTWHIDIYQDLESSIESKILTDIKERIESFDKVYSRFRPDSLVTKIGNGSGVFQLPADSEKLFGIYHNLYEVTDGFFTPLIGKLLSDAGYDAKYSLQQKGILESPPAWDDVMDYKNHSLIVKKPVMLDFGAAGKGYLIDLVGKVLEADGIYGYCIDAGGDILHKGSLPIRIGLENPTNKDQVVGVFPLINAAICGSAGNRRKWGNFNHIMNPKTLSSAKDILAVWVVAREALVADALTTCLFFVQAQELIKRLSGKYDFEYILIRNDLSFEQSDGFSAEIFS